MLPVGAGVGFKFQSSADAGAFVLLEPPGHAKDIESKRHIVNYMRENLERWLQFANHEWGLELKDHDMTFVCGTTKTSRFALAAFQGSNYRKKEGYITGNFGPFSTAGISINISNQTLPVSNYRHGPLNYGSSVPQLGYSEYHQPPSPNQCLFIHYYKMKRRFLWLLREPMQAAAGPHQLPPGDNAGGGAPMVPVPYEFEPESEQHEVSPSLSRLSS